MHGDLNAARLKAVTSPEMHNPLAFTDPIDRQAATLSRMQKIMENPNYQKLASHQQTLLRARYYDKYVAPGYAGSKLPIPDKHVWVEGVARKTFGPESYYEDAGIRSINVTGATAGKDVGQLFNGLLSQGIKISKQASLAQLGLYHFFPGAAARSLSQDTASVERIANYAQNVVNRISHDVINDEDFWLQTHPSKSMVDKVDSFVGDSLVQMPLYAAIGEARAASTPVNLTKALAKSKAATIVATSLGGAADAFMGSILQNQSKEETVKNMAAFAGFSGAGATVIASGSLMKKLIANVIWAGGRPLASAVSDEAIHEIENSMIHGAKAPENTEILPQHVMDAITRAHADDPLKVKLVTSYKAIVNSISHSNFSKDFKSLSPEQKSAVNQFHAELTADAIREMPAHMPEMSKANAKAAVSESQALDPEGAAWDTQMQQKHGVNFEDELYKSEQKAVKKQTGIQSSQGSTTKTVKATRKVNSGNAKRLSAARESEPRRFAQMKVDQLQYFRNPAKASGKDAKGFDYSKWLAGMDSKDFISEIRSHLGNDWFFEDPQHTLEHALTYSGDMPAAFKKRITEELHELDPEGTVKSWLDTGKKRDRHLDALATTGQLWSEGNVFRSSRFGPGQKPTKWQGQLYRDAALIKKNETNNLEAKLSSYKRNYPDNVAIGKRLLKSVQDAQKGK